MGQRLNIEIWNDGKVLANAYYHWSAYTSEAAALVQDILKYINIIDVNKDTLDTAIRCLEHTGAGFDESEIEIAKSQGIDLTKYKRSSGRNDGMIAVTEKGINETRSAREQYVTIHLDEQRVNFHVFYCTNALDWEMNQKPDYGKPRADRKDLHIIPYDPSNVKFSEFAGFVSFLYNMQHAPFYEH